MTVAVPEIISYSEAKARGLKRYYEGKPCRAGHNTTRFVSNRACTECSDIRSAGNGALLDKPAAPLPPNLRRRGTAQTVLGAIEAKQTPFAGWTPENRSQFIKAYVDTGDIATARDEIGVSASEYNQELKENSEFAAAVAEATPLARQHLKERAIQLGLRGNDKLLIAALKAEFPEFRDSLKVDMQTTVRTISNDELDRRIERLSRGQIIDAQFIEIKPGSETPALSAPGREGTESEPEPYIDPLCR